MNGTLMQVPATAAGWLATGTTAAGTYRVRVAGPQDADAIREFICGLSVRTQYFRFFTAVSPPSHGLLSALSGAGRLADVLIVTDAQGAVVAHGMAVDADRGRPSSADIGLVVADSWQGQGLGTVLLRLLAGRAAGRGISALLMEVRPDNARMLGIIDRHWPGAERRRTLDALSITARIGGRPAVPASAPHITGGGGRNEPARPAA